MKSKILLALLVSALPAACDSPDFDSVDDRQVLFDAVEINASLQEDPSQWFLVDISDGTVNYFDESSEDLDFSNFLFFCPSMTAPLPLEEVAADLLQDRPKNWSVQLAEATEGLRFRSSCIMICPGGTDCYQRCPAKLPDRPPLPPPAPGPL